MNNNDKAMVTPEMLRAAQIKSELGIYVTANWAGAYDVMTELYQVMHEAQPAAQHQGEPVALPERKNHVHQGLSHTDAKADGWNACLDEIAKLGPLYTHADPGEVEQLRSNLRQWLDVDADRLEVMGRMCAKLAVQETLLRKVIENEEGFTFDHDLMKNIKAALSTSAEPIVPEQAQLMEVDLNKIHGSVTCQPEGGVPFTVKSGPMENPIDGGENWSLTITGDLLGCRIVSEDVEPESDMARRIDFSWGGGITVEGLLPEGTTFKIHGPSRDASAPVERDELPPFAQKVLKKLRRTQACFEDSQGTDIGRDWLDVLVRLGLMNRVQRSPALWEISDAGDALLEARDALERKPSLERAFNEWVDKCQWARKDAVANELGMHLADVIKQRFDRMRAICVHLQDDLTARDEELDNLRMDAGRYRWLRDKSQSIHPFYLSVPIWFSGIRFRKENVDESIDSSMTEDVQP
ncbi:hypothetical protein H8F21_22045 [Pseudomonas sp. P66]|uniref:Uncharacterized protein n=1 Tax=Pseudomonas arcuscaelestis TaxID=2710591 RepID=A0ABS2C5C5_9PSED|nr:hypothetical protein [Pseudomonas arcuscaelestis]MBM5460249.1 hypothetical protein [Pseudomonas arcuscaelestis]